MNMIIGKKQIILAALVVALGIAVYLNYQFSKTDSAFGATSTLEEVDNLGEAKYVNSTGSSEESESAAVETVKINEEYFTQSKLSRQQAHDEALEILNAVIDNESASDSAKEAASLGIEKLAENLTLESDIENLVKAKGFKECVAMIQDEKAQIVVPNTGLLESEITQIKEIVMTTAKIDYENITIIEAK